MLIEIFGYLALGIVAGLLGGILGIGGSVVLIPVLNLIYGFSFHLSQAAAMTVNPCIAAPAAWEHSRAGYISWPIFWRCLPSGILFIISAAILSNYIPALYLQFIFGLFLIWVFIDGLAKLVRKRTEVERKDRDVNWWRCSLVGAITGAFSGLLGIGGGLATVPLLQKLCGLSLKTAIGTSSAIMILTTTCGALAKNMSLSEKIADGSTVNGLASISIAVWLIPTGIIGALIGAHLCHILPNRTVRSLFLILVAIAAIKMLVP